MAENRMGALDILVDLASKFVKSRMGVWDHTVWMEFSSDVQKKGFELSDDMKSYLGSVLESMTKLYKTATATKGMEDVMLKIFEHTLNYIKKTKGVWNPMEWEFFLADLQKKGIHLNDETMTYLGEVLESVRKLSTVSTAVSKKTQKKK